MYHEGEWIPYTSSHVDVTDLVPAKKLAQVLKVISFTVDESRSVEYGNRQTYKIYDFEGVYDLVNGEVKNLMLYSKGVDTGKTVDLNLNTKTRKEVQTRSCLLGGLVCP
jgi:hypothetical protein